METKKRLKRIQKFLMQSDLPARPAQLAKILGVAPSSLTRWLGGEEAKGKQREKIDMLYRTVLEAEAENPLAMRMVAQFARPIAGVGLLATGLIGAVAAAGLGWLLADKEDAETDNETETLDVDSRPEENADAQEIYDSREEDGTVLPQTRARRKVIW